MATRKKAKKKARAKSRKKKKVTKRKTVARKKVARKPARKKPVARKKPKKKKKTATKTKRKPAVKTAKRKTKVSAPTPKPASVVPAGEERVGIVTHYFNHLSVAVLRLETGALRAGDTIHIKGHTSDFYQPVVSMEIDHVHVDEARPGQSFGLRVKDHAREHDVVYKVPRR